MLEVIKVPTALYKRLAKHATGFDTPANVIERLLINFNEGVDADDAPEDSRSSSADTPSAPPSRRYEKYLFENREYGKGRLVLAVLTAHAKSNPHMTYSDLLATFPKQLQGSSGVLNTKETADEIFSRKGHKRHFINPDELITLEDAVIAVSNQWGVNTDNFIQHARALGYVITPKAEAG